MLAFKKTKDNFGYHIPLPNGYRVSVQYGFGNYCDNYDARITDYSDINENCTDSSTAETAIIDTAGELIEYKGDTVQPRQTPLDLLETINYAATL